MRWVGCWKRKRLMLLFDSNFLDTFYILLGNREMRLTSKPLLWSPGHFRSEVSKGLQGFTLVKTSPLYWAGQTNSPKAAAQTLPSRTTVHKGRSEGFSVKMLSALSRFSSFYSPSSRPPSLLSVYLLWAPHLTALVGSIRPCCQLGLLPWLPSNPLQASGQPLSPPCLRPPPSSELPTGFYESPGGSAVYWRVRKGKSSLSLGRGGGFLRGVPPSSQKGQTDFWLPAVESPSEGPVLLWVSKSHLWAKGVIKTFSQTFKAVFQTASCQFPSWERPGSEPLRLTPFPPDLHERFLLWSLEPRERERERERRDHFITREDFAQNPAFKVAKGFFCVDSPGFKK